MSRGVGGLMGGLGSLTASLCVERGGHEISHRHRSFYQPRHHPVTCRQCMHYTCKRGTCGEASAARIRWADNPGKPPPEPPPFLLTTYGAFVTAFHNPLLSEGQASQELTPFLGGGLLSR